ncbi:DHHA1 domain-containing protein [Virgibacillus kekensis]|uniref:DHHA1 domain-containing protein n=1 Tax=Virgibacillus kekensis TaxID=202261 RepID=A0ABV9DM96_9BACI
MATEKLFYQNQYIRSFSAKSVRSGTDEEGRSYVVLDQTAFYPTGGGQPHDMGTINGVNVLNVEEVEGEVRHYTAEPLGIHNEYTGEIDWERRFDHMQQHAGQHILSAAFEDNLGYKTVSFHLGKETCSIDLEVKGLTKEEMKQVENTANEIILENRPIDTKWVTKEELGQYHLRKDLSVSENIRLVIIPEFDYNGCGGTHPDSTGQVSSIKILHWEKQKKNKIRVYFVCGSRVLKQLGAKHQIVQGLTDTLNAPQEELNNSAANVLRQNKELEKIISELKFELIEYEADKLLDQEEIHRDQKIIKAIFSNRPMPELQSLAKTIADKSSEVLVMLVNENPDKLQLVCARGEAVAINMNDLIKQVLPDINGKGGGNASVAQGGGEKVIKAQELMERLVSKM